MHAPSVGNPQPKRPWIFGRNSSARSAEGSDKDRIDVACLGRTAMDILFVADGYPEPDTKFKVDEFSLQGGGPAATAAVTLRRLGFHAAYIGKVCDDMFGRFMVDSLGRETIDTRGVVVAPEGASQFAAIVIKRATGERTIFWTDGDVGDLEPEQVDLSRLGDIRALHLDGHFMRAALHTARHARDRGALVSFDAGTFRPGSDALARLCHIVIATPDFSRDFTGEDDPERAIARMASMGIPIAGVTLGLRGSLVAAGGKTVHQEAFEVDVVDTTGAGDVYHGAFLAAHLLGRDLKGCAELAAAASALKCTRLGGREGIPDLRTADAFVEERRKRIP